MSISRVLGRMTSAVLAAIRDEDWQSVYDIARAVPTTTRTVLRVIARLRDRGMIARRVEDGIARWSLIRQQVAA